MYIYWRTADHVTHSSRKLCNIDHHGKGWAESGLLPRMGRKLEGSLFLAGRGKGKRRICLQEGGGVEGEGLALSPLAFWAGWGGDVVTKHVGM